MAKKKPLYSVWKPATSSLSASGMSKGARFVSARPAVKKTRNAIGMMREVAEQEPVVQPARLRRR